ncbi:MAG TPA: GNAT family N-acetyltransferase [Thermomicrobiaceae bacterium]|nr:GNAT family N-acetyltransferase [Thermomicrobiaceae bacterium]
MESAERRKGTVRRRVAGPEDRAVILELAQRLAEQGMPPWRDAQAMSAFHRRYADAATAASGPLECVLVAEDAGRLIGFVHVIETADGLTGEVEGYVATLAVSSSVEGQGVGRTLMAAAEDWSRARGHRLLTLETFAFNDRARRFYGRLGYVEETIKLVKEL